MSGESWVVNSDRSLDNFIAHAKKLYDDKKYITFKWNAGRQRSELQNRAIHVFCREIAESLNNAGIERETSIKIKSNVLKNVVDVPWSMELVKDLIWRPVQLAKYPEKESTVKLERAEVSDVAEIIIKHLGENFGIYVPFPDRRASQ
nr:hypothetical protein [uncultured Mediterranean phage uvMED]